MTPSPVRCSSRRDSEQLERQIRTFIVEELLEEPFDGDDPLSAEALDSLGIQQLICYLEDEFEIKFDDTELVRRNFSSVHAVTALVNDKQQPARRAANA